MGNISLAPTKSPGRSQNGRDNTEAIDMEMSDEDFELPEFLEASESMLNLFTYNTHRFLLKFCYNIIERI